MIQLHRAEYADCPLLHRIQVRSFRGLLEKYQDFETNPAAEGLEKIHARYAQAYTTYYLITVSGDPVGMVRVCDLGSTCRVSPICVLPEFQGRGYASQAMLELERSYPSAKCWELDTIAQEENLCRFYEKLSYRRTGQPHRIKEGMDLVSYRKQL